MPHSLPKIWVHVVFSTKNRVPLIKEPLGKKLYPFIRNQLQEKKCYLKTIGGIEDHIHMLFSLHQNISLADMVKQIKGASAYWINHNDLISEKFSWQTGYGAFSVSESQKARVQKYIENQKEHHRTKSFQEELDQIVDLDHLEI